jgi:hypothetical protein
VCCDEAGAAQRACGDAAVAVADICSTAGTVILHDCCAVFSDFELWHWKQVKA